MTPEQWERIKELFEAALDREPDRRAAFLAEACRGDDALRAEVERLLSEHEQAGSFLKPVPGAVAVARPRASPSRLFSEQEVVAGRFRIVRFIGQGGMGEVYEAEDLDLHERVALKTVRPEIASDARALARFKQEIQLARKITHPNVCRIFDLARHVLPPEVPGEGPREVLLLTMELLEGETLAARLLRGGPMSTAEAFPIARQMAEALDAAHRAQIIHRDFKSVNVVLAPSKEGEVRAVVTDFGLARRIAPDDSAAAPMTTTGRLLGTPAYMSPEQLEGREVTAATDIYSLGVVLYEMVTGRRPFEDDSPFVAAFRRLHQPPPSPRVHVSDLDERWEAVILRCLDREPEGRFACAADVVKAIAGENVTTASVQGKRIPGRDSRLRSQWRRGPRAIFWLTAGGLGVLLVFASLLLWNRANTTVRAGSSVLLTEIENVTHDPQLDAVTDVLRSQLNQSPHFRVLENAEVRQALQRMVRPPDQRLDAPSAREVALRQGVPLVVFGNLSRLGQDYSLNLKVERVGTRPDRPQASWLRNWNVPGKKELFGAIREGSTWIRKMAGESARDLADNDLTPEESTTDSWEALGLFAESQRRKAQDKEEEAVLLLKEAADKDPQFALAYMRLGDILFSLHKFDEGYRYWQKALDTLKVRHVSKREEFRIKGLYASDTGDYASAERIFSTFTIHYPNDWMPWFYRARPLAMLGRVEEAIESLRGAQGRAPQAYYMPVSLAYYNIVLGQLDEALRQARRARELGQDSLADSLEGAVAFLRGDYGKAEEFFLRMRNSKDRYGQATGYTLQACLLSEMARYGDAIRVLNEGIAADLPAGRSSARADKLLALAYLHYRLGRRDASRTASLEAAALDPSWGRFVKAGTMLARQGFVVEARQLLERLPQEAHWPLLQVALHQLKGEILLAQGKNGQALAEFRKADVLAAPVEHREYLAHALALSGEPGQALPLYEKIVQKPGQIWQGAHMEFPGFWNDAQFQYARLGLLVGKPGAKDALEQYLKRRDHADPDLSEVQEALRLRKQARNPM